LHNSSVDGRDNYGKLDHISKITRILSIYLFFYKKSYDNK